MKKEQKDKQGLDNRELTEKEKVRNEVFQKNRAELLAQGYREVPLTVSVIQANTVGLLTTVPFIIVLVVLFILFNRSLTYTYQPEKSLIVLFAFLALTVVHELIHGFTWGCFAQNKFNSIEFGVIWKLLTPYCACKEVLNKRQYILGSAMPTIILGFLLGAIAIVTGNISLVSIAALNMLGGSGDFLIIYKILRHKTTCKDVLYCDHPYECGGVVFEK